MSASGEIAYYDDGVPYNSKGEVIIIITGHIPEGGGGGGTTSGGNFGGATSQSGHSLAKWSTENLKKSQAELQKSIAHINQLIQNQTTLVKQLSANAKAVADRAIAFARRGPTVTDKAHETNAKMEYEAQLQGFRKAQAEAEKKYKAAQAEAKKQQEEYERKQKELEENERKLKEAEAEEKRIAELNPEERALVYAERDLAQSKENIITETNNINAFNQKLNANQNQINSVSNSLRIANEQMVPLKVELDNAIKNAKATERYANDSLLIRIFLNGRARLVNSSHNVDNKQNEINGYQNRINQLNQDSNNIRNQLAEAQRKKAEAEAQRAANEAKVKKAKEDLSNATFKEMFDKVNDIFERVSKYYQGKYSNLAKEFAEQAKGKQVKNVTDALEKYEKYYDVLNKKFSVKDRTAITNALKSIQYDDWARQFHIFARGFGYTGKISAAYDAAKHFEYGIDTGDWKPFFVDTGKWLADKAVVPVLASLVSYLVAAFPILGGAITTAILLFILYTVVSYLIEHYVIDDISDALNNAVK